MSKDDGQQKRLQTEQPQVMLLVPKTVIVDAMKVNFCWSFCKIGMISFPHHDYSSPGFLLLKDSSTLDLINQDQLRIR